MSPTTSTDVLIVGAGPTGLVLACELARRQIAFRLIDAMPQPSVASRGKGLQPRSLEVFDDLGVVDHIIANGRFHMPMRFHDLDGSVKDHDPYESYEPKPDAPYPSPLLIPQWRIENILRERLTELGGCVEFATSLDRLEQDETSVTAAVIRDGTAETVRAKWLVGCDGGRSKTRNLLGVDFIGETLEMHRMFVADVKATNLDRDHWHAWRSEKGFVALAPLPSTDMFQFQATLSPEEPAEPSIALFQEILNTRTGRQDIQLHDATWMSFWRANVRMVDRYRVGRAFLAGDAAHVHSPAGGQGMNTGIQDAYNLGWKMAAVIHGADPELLDTYEEERMPIAAWVLGVSNKLLAQFAQTQNVIGQRNAETLQLGIHYRNNKLAKECRANPGNVAAGDRAPDAPDLQINGQTYRMFDLIRGTHFTVLAFGEGWNHVIDDIAARYGSVINSFVVDGSKADDEASMLRDRVQHAVRGYDIHNDTLMIIRPDGYIGLATEEKTSGAVLDYLATTIGVTPMHAPPADAQAIYRETQARQR
jgi:2-polyprenyl-6-methoxyphenol hydroxylase-like FAD-dependent oxidoreductase